MNVMRKIYFLLVFIPCQFIYGQFEFIQVADINPGSNSSNPKHFFEYNGELYFNAQVSFQQRLYKTSGSGATLVADLNGNGVGYNPKPLFVINNKLIFHASTQTHGMELFVTDGTTIGTQILLDIFPGADGSSVSDNPEFFAVLNNELYFWAKDTSGPFSLWKTDGTTAGTIKILDPSFAGAPNPMVVYNNRIYFSAASSSGENFELYRTDGTASGTGLFKEINPSTSSSLAAGSSPRNFIVYDGFLFFSADDGTNGRELWRTDGTASETIMVADIFPNNLNSQFGKDSNPSYFIEFNNELFFTARGYDVGLNQITGNELYKYSVLNGRELVKDIYPGNLNNGFGTSNPFVILNNQLFFMAQDGTTGNNQFELWRTDGTENGTTKALNLANLGGLSLENFISNKDFAILNNKLFFEHNSQRIWVTDGTPANTLQITGNGANNTPVNHTNFQPVVFNDEIYFDGNYPTQGVEVWKIKDSSLSVNMVENGFDLIVYPNPTTSLINIKSKKNEKIDRIELYNTLGKKVITEKVENINSIVNTNYLAPGLYVLKIFSNNKYVTKRIIKK